MCQTNSFRNELNFTFRNGVLIESLACVLDLQVSDVIFFSVFRYLTEKYLFQINCEVEEEPYNQPKITIGQGQCPAKHFKTANFHFICKMFNK